MIFSVALRYRSKEYYSEFSGDSILTFGTHKADKIHVADSFDHLLSLSLVFNTLTAQLWNGMKVPVEYDVITPLLRSEEAYLYVSRVSGNAGSLELPYQGRLSCGRKPDNDIQLTFPIVSGHHFQLLLEGGRVHVEDLNSTNHIYVNGRRVEKAMLSNGDVLSIYTFRFELTAGRLVFHNMGTSVHVKHAQEQRPSHLKSEVRVESRSTLQYHLSPRIREQLPSEAIILSAPPNAMTAMGGRRGSWAYMIGSGAMMAASLATGMLNPVTLLMRATSLVSPIANILSYKKMNKEQQQQVEEYERMRQETYRTYIDDQKARIKKIADVQRRIVTEENRTPIACMNSAMRLERSLWERMAMDSDFLTTRLGIGQNRLCVEVKTRADVDGFQMDDDELEKLSAQIIEETRYVDNMPVCVSLKNYQTVGLIGPKDRVAYELRGIIVALTTTHSCRDVRLVGLFDRSDQSLWGVLRWLPHIGDESGQVHYIGFSPKDRHNVCELINETLCQRRKEASEDYKKRDQQPLPHYVVIVQSRELIQNEAIYDALISNDSTLGITTIFMAANIYELPQTCQFIVELGNKPVAYDRNKYDERLYFAQDESIHQNQMDAFSRRLAAIELENRYAEQAIPGSITFLQGYGVETVEDLKILDRWNDSASHLSLAAPIGKMAGNRTFALNIRSADDAHGPHGLLAGTTGSGKSELLQTWILSMAVNFHPHDVNFVIIDYKGGGMSDLMEPLPHVVGKITNIDRNIGRSLVSLKSELKRRMRLFSEAGVNNLSKYHRAFEEGRATVRLPHLIIVTDEFAEMKKEEPEFMAELNSVATEGRSLGIHMLLATQKPAGVVNDQINSNSRFRICMKVQDVTDSREMLKRPDAARITQAGRAYIRVGEDELFELFQSFYSGAPYVPHQNPIQQGENQVRIVGVTGNRINCVKKRVQKAGDVEDQLTAVIRHINELCNMMGLKRLPGPWLPELEKWLPLEKLGVEGGFDGTSWTGHRRGVSVPVGRYDIPAHQEQGVLELDFTENGHFAVYGLPGSGKTTLLKTTLTSFGMYYTPDEVSIIIIDAGNWSMSEMAAMPHVREVILNQETEKLKGFILHLMREIDARKKAFLKAAVNSLQAYRETVSSDLPAWIIAIDNLPALFEQSIEFSELMEEVATSGATYGIHLIFTANTTTGMKYKFNQLIKGAIALRLPDKGDYINIVGPVNGVSLPYNPGRALLRSSTPVAFQTAIYVDMEADAARSNALVELLEKMNTAWKNKRQQTILRGHETEEDASSMDLLRYEQRDCLPIGVDTNDLSPVSVRLSGDSYILAISSDDVDAAVKAMDAAEAMLSSREENQVYRLNNQTDEETLRDTLDSLVGILNDRKKHLKQRKKEEDFNPETWVAGYTQLCLLIDDLPAVSAKLTPEQTKKCGLVFTMASGLGLIILASAKPVHFADKSETDQLVVAAGQARKALCLGGKPLDHGRSTSGDPRELNYLDDDEAAFYEGNSLRIIRRRWR